MRLGVFVAVFEHASVYYLALYDECDGQSRGSEDQPAEGARTKSMSVMDSGSKDHTQGKKVREEKREPRHKDGERKKNLFMDQAQHHCGKSKKIEKQTEAFEWILWVRRSAHWAAFMVAGCAVAETERDQSCMKERKSVVWRLKEKSGSDI